MRRSLAPSQTVKPISRNNQTNSSSNNLCDHQNDSKKEKMITIKRLPLCGFLHIPESLNKQFKVPSGCAITARNIELRLVKTLGPQKNINILKPGQGIGFLKPSQLLQDANTTDGNDENEEEDLPKANLAPFEPLVLWQSDKDPTKRIEVVPSLASKLRPHQREGVQFLFECTLGLRGFDGFGCILADDMGLGKTLMSITLLWTLIHQGYHESTSIVRKVIIVCPTSLIGNWDNEIRKWVGDQCPTFAVKSDPKKMIQLYLNHRGKGILIISYETQRLYSKLFEASMKSAKTIKPPSDVIRPTEDDFFHRSSQISYQSWGDLLICDEAHKLKNADSGLSKSLQSLAIPRRILLSGTPMQNELTEFYNMVNFCNPMVLGSIQDFRRRYERPILASREPDALDSEIRSATQLQKELSVIVNEFILKRGNILNAQHLPPKLIQFVCCRLSPLQDAMYQRLLSSKEIRHVREGKQTNTLNSIRQLINICSHPKILMDTYEGKRSRHEVIDDDLEAVVELIRTSSTLPPPPSSSGRLVPPPISHKKSAFVDPELSGKMIVLYRMMQTMRALKQGERIVIVSNYTQTLDLIQCLCTQNHWPTLRLDGTVTSTKRTKIVDEFNNPHSSAFAFLLSSKAGGCGINLIGGNRLVLFDPDWNPASDKQAAARIWREGQRRRCYIYRFMSTGTIEEKIIQRQLSKEGLADIVDDKQQVNQFSTSELKQLFTYYHDTKSDTHDTLRCKRCRDVKVKELPSNQLWTDRQMNGCEEFLDSFLNELKMISKEYLERSHPTRMSFLHEEKDDFPWARDLIGLKDRLKGKEFPSLPAFSRRQRELVMEIDQQINESRKATPSSSGNSISSSSGICAATTKIISGSSDGQVESVVLSSEIMTETAHPVGSDEKDHPICDYFPTSFNLGSLFLARWTEKVPTLTARQSVQSCGGVSSTVTTNDNLGGPDDQDFADQEGCPEETDFNRWSHHGRLDTCDDELLKVAVADDATVSFIFGLEVNWDLLLMREQQNKEEGAIRKEQSARDLEALNQRRNQGKQTIASSGQIDFGSSSSSDKSDRSGNNSGSSSSSGSESESSEDEADKPSGDHDDIEKWFQQDDAIDPLEIVNHTTPLVPLKQDNKREKKSLTPLKQTKELGSVKKRSPAVKELKPDRISKLRNDAMESPINKRESLTSRKSTPKPNKDSSNSHLMKRKRMVLSSSSSSSSSSRGGSSSSSSSDDEMNVKDNVKEGKVETKKKEKEEDDEVVFLSSKKTTIRNQYNIDNKENIFHPNKRVIREEERSDVMWIKSQDDASSHKSIMTPLSSDEALVGSQDSWTCMVCTFMNKSSQFDRCSVCKSEKRINLDDKRRLTPILKK